MNVSLCAQPLTISKTFNEISFFIFSFLAFRAVNAVNFEITLLKTVVENFPLARAVSKIEIVKRKLPLM